MISVRLYLAVAYLATLITYSDSELCNDGIDAVMPMLQKDIKCVSPHEADIEYCTCLTVWGGESICRNGDIETEKKADGCIYNTVQFCFEKINFQCNVNMAKLEAKAKEVAQQKMGVVGGAMVDGMKGGKGMMGRKRRDMFDEEMEKTALNQENIVNGTWDGLCLGGTLKCCNGKCTDQGLMMTKLDLTALCLSCHGGQMLTEMCSKMEGDNPMVKEMKSCLVSFMQVEFVRIVSGCICDGPADIGNKLSCDNPGKAGDANAYTPKNCRVFGDACKGKAKE